MGGLAEAADEQRRQLSGVRPGAQGVVRVDVQPAVLLEDETVHHLVQQRGVQLLVQAGAHVAEPGGEHHQVGLRPLHRPGVQLPELHDHPAVLLPDGGGLPVAPHEDPLLAVQALLVDQHVQLAQHVAVRRGVVGGVHVGVQRLLALPRGLVVVAGELGEVALLTERAGVLLPQAVRPDVVDHLRAREPPGQVQCELHGALAAADHRDGAGLLLPGQLRQPEQVLRQVEHPPRVGPVEGLRQVRRAAGRDHQRAAQVAAAVGGLHLVHLLTVHGGQGDPGGPGVAVHQVTEVPGGPADVAGVLLAQRVLGREVEVLQQPALLVQVVEEAVAAARVAQGHQVATRVVLDVGSVEQHAGLPLRRGLGLQEPQPGGREALLQRDGQRQVRRTEADAEHVVDRRVRPDHRVGRVGLVGIAHIKLLRRGNSCVSERLRAAGAGPPRRAWGCRGSPAPHR